MRPCSCCKSIKPLVEYPKLKSSKDGHGPRCKTCNNKASQRYYRNNKEKHKKAVKKWRDRVISEGFDINSYSKDFNKRNPRFKRFYSAQRKKRIKKATPDWLTPEDKRQIRDIYFLREKLSLLCGVDYHVDHIVPISGVNICGLHVPWNLQIMEASLNLRKRNHYYD